MKIIATFYYHLREKAGTGSVNLEVNKDSTIGDLKFILEGIYPNLRTHLDNIMILMNGKIVLNEDKLIDGAKVIFMTPVGGG